MDRYTIAYILIAMLVSAVVAWVLHARHHGHQRTVVRIRKRDTARYEKTIMEKNAGDLRESR